MTTNDKIQEFLNNFSSYGTRRTYGSALKRYFNTIKKDPNTYFTKGKGQYTAADIEMYEKDVKAFWQSLNTMPPNTIKNYLAAVKVFMTENYVDMPSKVWKDITKRTRGSRSVIEDYIPAREDIKKLASHGGAMERALVLSLASSGIRIGELCQIKEDDIDFDSKPVKINIRREYTKTGNRRITFVSDECADALREWIKEKPGYLLRTTKSFNLAQTKNKAVVDDRVFPLHSINARRKWNILLRKTGEHFADKDTNTKTRHYKLHPHCLRKFFRTNLPGGDMDVDIVEALMGHEDGLQRAYRKYSEKQMGDKYLASMHKVMVFSTQSEDVKDLNEKMLEKDKQIANMQQHINDIDQQLRKLLINKLIEDDKKK